mmetsp:Transcript_6911/g.20832  ORF Transcript_6911/g.20832 Transcript_6911/m.20832 type:complete len:214 (-) Transcript_6911:861-1502(-)
MRRYLLRIEKRLAKQSPCKVEICRGVIVGNLCRRVYFVCKVVDCAVLPKAHVHIKQRDRHQLEPLTCDAAGILRWLASKLEAEDAAHVVRTQARKAGERILKQVGAAHRAAHMALLPGRAKALQHASEPPDLLVKGQARRVLEVSCSHADIGEACIHRKVHRVYERKSTIRFHHTYKATAANPTDGNILHAMQELPLFKTASGVHSHRLETRF